MLRFFGIFCVLSLGSTLPSRAENPVDAEQREAGEFFRTQALIVPKILARRFGLADWNGIRFAEFERRVAKTKIFWWEHRRIQGQGPAGDLRMGARYDRREIHFSWQTGIDLKNSGLYPVMALHECLGAAGYPDRNYENSFAMYAVARADQIPALAANQLLANFQQTAENPSRLAVGGGGGTQTGGGGDSGVLRFKADLLEQFMTKDPEKLPTIAMRLRDLRIERDPSHIGQGGGCNLSHRFYRFHRDEAGTVDQIWLDGDALELMYGEAWRSYPGCARKLQLTREAIARILLGESPELVSLSLEVKRAQWALLEEDGPLGRSATAEEIARTERETKLTDGVRWVVEGAAALRPEPEHLTPVVCEGLADSIFEVEPVTEGGAVTVHVSRRALQLLHGSNDFEQTGICAAHFRNLHQSLLFSLLHQYMRMGLMRKRFDPR